MLQDKGIIVNNNNSNSINKKNIVFMVDVDGVIAITPQMKAWKKAAKALGLLDKPNVEGGFELFYAAKMAGEPGYVGAKNLLIEYGSKDIINFEQEIKKLRVLKAKIYDDMVINKEYKYNLDILNTLKYLKNKGFPIVAVSSSESAHYILNGILEFFNITALGTETHWPKKVDKINHYSMAYGKILALVKGYPNVIVFEDAPQGITAVTKLGFYAIGIAKDNTKENLLAAGAKQTVETLTPEDVEIALRRIYGEYNSKE